MLQSPQNPAVARRLPITVLRTTPPAKPLRPPHTMRLASLAPRAIQDAKLCASGFADEAPLELGEGATPDQTGVAEASVKQRQTQFYGLRTPQPLSTSALVSLLSLAVNFFVLHNLVGTAASFAILFVIGCHELGHLAVARWFKVPVLWPIFVPWIGACVVMLKPANTEREKAWIGIAGPIAGLAANLVVHHLGQRLESPGLLEVAIWGYSVHLFNMIPAGMLDGGHIAGFLGRWLWLPGAAGFALFVFFMEDLSWYTKLIVVLVALPAAGRAATILLEWARLKTPPKKEERCIKQRMAMWVLLGGIVLVCGAGVYRAKAQVAELINNSIEIPWEAIHKLASEKQNRPELTAEPAQ